MKPTLYPNGFPSAYEELKTFYPVFYRDVFEMDAIWRAAGGGLDEIEDGVDAVVNNNFVSLMDTDTLAQMETFLGIPLNQKRTLEARRKLVALYFIGGNHIGSQEIKDIVFGYTGASSSVEFKNSRIYVKLFPNDNSTFLSSDVMECLKRKIPAHLSLSLVLAYIPDLQPASLLLEYLTICTEEGIISAKKAGIWTKKVTDVKYPAMKWLTSERGRAEKLRAEAERKRLTEQAAALKAVLYPEP